MSGLHEPWDAFDDDSSEVLTVETSESYAATESELTESEAHWPADEDSHDESDLATSNPASSSSETVTLSSIQQSSTQKLKDTVPGYMLDPTRSYADWVVSQELFVPLQRSRLFSHPRPEATEFSLNRELADVYRSLLLLVDDLSRTRTANYSSALIYGIRVASTAFDYSAICLHLPPTRPTSAPTEDTQPGPFAPLKPRPAVRHPLPKHSITELEQIISLSREIHTQLKTMRVELDELDEDCRRFPAVYAALEIRRSVKHHLVKLLGLFDILILASEQVLKLLHTLPELTGTENHGTQSTLPNGRGTCRKAPVARHSVSTLSQVVHTAYERYQRSFAPDYDVFAPLMNDHRWVTVKPRPDA